MEFISSPNPYNDEARAAAYTELGIVNTYYLAYRDLPCVFAKHMPLGTALDYGCGSGRSTRFLRDQGFSVVGADISLAMISRAREQDPEGDYHLINPADLTLFPNDMFDLILSVMTFDSISTVQEKVDTLSEMSRVLKPGGLKILVAASSEVYLREWVSFSTADFPENHLAQSGDVVHIIIKDIGDRRAVEDTLWTEVAYEDTFRRTPLHLIETSRPTATTDDEYQCEWISEQNYAPWVMFVLRNSK